VPAEPTARAGVWAVVVAAGSGSRFGAPKQYEPLAGRRVIDHSLDAAREWCDGVVLVVPPERAGTPEPSADVVVAGGATRSESVRRGLAAVPDAATVVVVHDGARPMARAALWRSVIDAVVGGADAAVPVVPVTDTLRHIGGGTIDRDRVVAVQTPQAFASAALRQAHATGPESTDDASLVEAGGGRVVTVAGDPANLKITNPVDLVVAGALCR
jgi:2-C-methyl-D-erythritol 4-phosphate cytidylyltransferase